MRTGDLATIDNEGYCNIVGRIEDMVIRGGENVYPREIEEFLYRHPKIQDVQVIGVPDPRYGEELCAWVRLHDSETATRDRHFGRDPRLLPRADRPLQGAALRQIRRRLSDDGYREDPEIPDAAANDPRN
jgi:acyl-CoA synthetase (AMP-forming)/AMP-acid ligase II